MNQPRSKLKLPIKELIKARTEVESISSSNSVNTALQMKSNADWKLERLRSDSSEVIPRLETVNEIAKDLAIEGSWEKAESLILNMKRDCKRIN